MEDQHQTNVNSSPGGSGKSKLWLTILGIIVAVVVTTGVVYLWQQQQAKKQQAALQSQIEDLKKQVTAAEEKAKKAEAAKTASTDKAKECKTLSSTQLDNVHDSISSMNTAAMEGYLAAKVQYVLAASELGKDMTPAEVIESLDYLKSATEPWNWNIAAATLNEYKTGDYKTYIVDDNVFGVSANKYFVSMRDNCGKIDQIFVSSSTDLL